MKNGFQQCLATRIVLAVLACVPAAAPLVGQSLPEALEAIDHVRVATRILYVTAHPDDESSSVLTYLARGLHADVALLSITRGEGGQNALGPEQGPPLGILRTEELLAATRTYGVRLYFTRAPDFGYSKTPEETLKVWGDTALDDMVRVIRTFRPHVIINNWGGVRTGHGHHQAAGILTPRASAAAGDPRAFPHQLEEGLDTWKPALLLQLSRDDASGGLRLPLDEISPLWGKTYREIGLGGFVHHRTQGIAGFLNSPFLRRLISLVAVDGAKLEPAQLAFSLSQLADHLPMYEAGVKQADRRLAAAREDGLRLDWAAAGRELAAAALGIAELRGQLTEVSDSTEYRLREELRRVAQRIDTALAAAVALRVEAQADRSEIVGGETFTVRVRVQRRGEVPGG